MRAQALPHDKLKEELLINRQKEEVKIEKETKKMFVCPKCGGTEVVYSYGKKDTLCKDCGTPLSEFELRE